MKSSSPASGPDEDGYWPVSEIIEESGSKYKVLWGGTDPDTGEPWPSSWVPKSDCTDRLVSKWRAKLKLRKEGASGPASADGSSETTSRVGAKRKCQPNDSADSDGCDDLVKTQSSTENLNSKQESSLSLSKVGPPRGIPKKRSGPSEATNRVTAKRKRQHEDSADGCKDLVKAQSAKDFDKAKQEFSPGLHSMKVGPPRGVMKKRSGIVSGDYLPGEDVPGPCSSSESKETVLKLKQKWQFEEPTDGCDDPEDPETVKAKFGKQEKQNLAVSPDKLGPSLCVRKVQPGSTLVSDFSLPPPGHVPALHVTRHQQQCSTSASRFDPPPAKATSPASRDMHRERLGLQRGSPSSATTQSKGTNAVSEVDQLQPEHSKDPNCNVILDLPQLLAKVEEIKRLQCAISINSNAAMSLSIEVIEALNVVQKDSQQHSC